MLLLNMTTPIQIIEADYDDPRHLRDLSAMLNAYAQDPMGGGKPLDEEVLDRVRSGLQSHPAAMTFLAYRGAPEQDNALPVGIVNCFLGFSTFRGKPLINIHDLAVAPEARKQGVARLLLDAVKAKGEALGCCAISLEVRDDNPAAQKLYQSYGFHDDGVPHRFWKLTL